jgi:heme A synthase
MMALLLVAAFLGGLMTFVVLLPLGVLTALVAAPLGGSLLTLMAGLLLAYLRTKAERRVEPTSNTPTAADMTGSATR